MKIQKAPITFMVLFSMFVLVTTYFPCYAEDNSAKAGSDLSPAPWGAETIADITEKVGSTVVNIDLVKKVKLASPFKDFEKEFGSFGFDLSPEFKEFSKDRIIPQKGAGSGFIIDDKGHILTNYHVVVGAEEIKITLKDGRKFDAKVIGLDESLDLAVLKIEASNLPIALLGDSSKIRPGQWAIAIGNPYGFANSVSAGIISATGRSLEDIGKKNLIQIDVPINPGNSGGPLLNLKGEVIGVNAAIVSGAQSIGFAVPINAAKEVLAELIDKGKVVRAWFGVYMRDVDEKIAAYLELPVAEGIVVTDVAKNSPADNMGMKKYDVIREVNGTDVASSLQLQELVQKMKPGDKVSVKVYREGKIQNLEGRLAEK